MQVTPPEADVIASLNTGQACIVRATLVADLETPVAAYIKLTQAFGHPSFLLESVEGGAQRGRYTMIGLAPDLLWHCEGRTAAIDRRDGKGFVPDARDALASLRALIAESRIAGDAVDLPPMAAGLFGYLGYDMVRLMERLAAAKPDPIGVPDALMMRPTIMVVFDNVKDQISVLTPVYPKSGMSGKALHEAALERIDRVILALEFGCAPRRSRRR